MPKNILALKHLHLCISALAVIMIGLFYGLTPPKFLALLFDYQVATIDLHHVFKAIMGLYLAIATYWCIGIYKTAHWRNATITNIVFMGGLSFGRIISLAIDGLPSSAFLIGLVTELLFMSWGMYNLKIH